MTTSLSAIARDRNIRYFLISFTDLFGVQRAKLVPAESIDTMASSGAGFAGFAAWLDMTPADPDILAIPDPERLYQLPWQPEIGWMPADLYGVDGQPIEQTPRLVLKRVLQQAAEMGFRIRTGVECEYFLLDGTEHQISDLRDRQSKPCYDQQSLMRRYDVIREICDGMLGLGWGAYQNDHEDANGQFEMNWTYADALVTADRQAFFKYMVKAIAEKHGLRATFMPKPFVHLTGNGCHTHISAWDLEGKENLFFDPQGELGLSSLAYQFIGGVLHSAEALCAIAAPSVNSYKRINAPVTLSGATWSPNTISYSGNNRTHTIRIPDAGRFELRLPDGAANPYLLPAALIAAGLDGIRNKRDPGPRMDNNTYTEPSPAGTVRSLPSSLPEALHFLQSNEVLPAAMGDSFTSAYLKLKRQMWNEYSAHISTWELENTLDC
ncbi:MULTISPECIES: type III glutamate--ammonia ligase [unclassified Leptolyngbya]|uniref:type III glutamate--ammonia ligase n=1 Tax=unclassified Leptolyngbya TaxID=2650499 RepID=UPI001683B898|nr:MULTISPECIES: type III glutamate--ammonia ligase [unclassified Leptolyngbya]MBD1913743.1 type III glutamate--ammonia ligase [Leptolyngbya sp. FACHB-8]MBD2153221.1 type III glutamate--ammonia ligase [Leptolyngbya sp. FACHB-16]